MSQISWEVETLQAEKLRTTLLTAVFSIFTLVWILINVCIPQLVFHLPKALFLFLPIYLMCTALYFLLMRHVICQYISRGKKLPTFLRYFNSFIEISIPTGALIFATTIQTPVSALLIPPLLIYFLFIILSALTLNEWICRFAGLIAALEYLGLSYYVLNYTNIEHIANIDYSLVSGLACIARGLTLLIGGVITGFVTEQIKKHLFSVFEAQNERNRAVQDTAEQKRLKEQLSSKNKELEKQNRLKSEFLANMSHDIRTPLAGVVGLSKLLEDMVHAPDQKQYAQWLGQSGEQLLNMLNIILDTVSEENVDESNLIEEPFKLKQVIEEILHLELPSTITKGINLKTHIDDNIPLCLVSDSTKLRRILLNLIGNAIKFTQTGQIKIEVKLLKQMKTEVLLNFSVSDTGIGIPYELQDKVFDKFFRIPPSNKGAYTGHGLGLHIAQSYANLLGGEIRLISKPGVGTTFYFDLLIKIGDINKIPLNDKKPLKVTQSYMPSKAKNKTSLNGPKLLLVEDNHIALLTLEVLVSQAGFRYNSTNDGEKALDLVKSERFDLIITDLGLQGLSGLELTQRIRKYEKKHHRMPTPIIGLTGHAENKIKDKCIKAGMNDAITKPISPEVLEKIKSTYLAPVKATLKQESLSTPENNTQKFNLDLPDTEEELFKLDVFPILDVNQALTSMGNNTALLKSTLSAMIEQEIPNSFIALEKAYSSEDWVAIEKLVHQLKGGLVYCGAVKLVYACQYLERYCKTEQVKLLKPLYKQLGEVIVETKDAINQWLLL